MDHQLPFLNTPRAKTEAQRQAIFAVEDEIDRQEDLRNQGRFERTPYDMDPHEFLRVLVEEVGEIARSIHEHDSPNYWDEVTQVAAIALSHLTRRYV